MAILSGMENICKYCNQSKGIVLSWIINKKFPVSKLGGGKWLSHTDLIDAWIKDNVSASVRKKIAD